MQRSTSSMSANSCSQSINPPIPEQTWHYNQGLNLQRQMTQLCEKNIDFSRSPMLHCFEPHVETIYQSWCIHVRIKGLSVLAMCALGQTVMRWLTHDPLRPQILPHDAQVRKCPSNLLSSCSVRKLSYITLLLILLLDASAHQWGAANELTLHLVRRFWMLLFQVSVRLVFCSPAICCL